MLLPGGGYVLLPPEVLVARPGVQFQLHVRRSLAGLQFMLVRRRSDHEPSLTVDETVYSAADRRPSIKTRPRVSPIR